MRRALRFILALVAGLALLTWGASVIVSRTTRGWFDRDIQLRAQLVVNGARDNLERGVLVLSHFTGAARLRRREQLSGRLGGRWLSGRTATP